MIKSELIKKVAKANRLTHDEAEQVVVTVLDAITQALVDGDRVELRGFGVLSVRDRQSRAARNPKTGARVNVAAKRIPFFKAGKTVRAALNKKSS